MIAGITMDNYKRAFFRKHLEEADFVWTEHKGDYPDTSLFKVTYTEETFDELERVVRIGNDLIQRRN